jgi:diamine N-acetyltransferase
MISIRKAIVDDALLLADIGKRSFIESHGHSASAADIDTYVSQKYTPAAMQEELNNPANIYHIITWCGQPAGYSNIVLNATHKDIPVTNATCLDRLYLLQEFYNLKLGLQLFHHNLLLSQQAAQAGMWLYTWTENKRALSFYQKAGFQIMANTFFKISDTHSNPNYIMYLDYARL